MKFENTEVMNFVGALRGMRNPMNSWDKSDSGFGCIKRNVWGKEEKGIRMCDECGATYDSKCICQSINGQNFVIGENDMKLAQKLIRAGSEHRKFMRQIFVSVDITAPSYFMAELDTYKIGVTRNSCSFMHRGISKRFEIEDFEIDDDRIFEILSTRKIEKENHIFYPYETDEYKIYTTENGRKYKVYKNGRIISLAHSVTDITGKTKGRTRYFEEREVIPSITKQGYWEINIGGRKGERWLLHRLVASVWLKNVNNLETVDHIDNNKNNNSVENLEWVTREENVKREFEDDLFRKDNIKSNYLNWKASSKITPFDKFNIKKMNENGLSQKEIADKFNISQSQISVVIRNAKNTSDNYELFESCWMWEQLLNNLNMLRDKYLDTKDYKYFRLIRQILPQGYLYRSTITMSYENLFNICNQRKNHKLNEWSGKDDSTKENFISWARTLPYAQELIFLDELEGEKNE